MMSNENLETETLEELAEKITRYATEADGLTIEAAKMIRATRVRIENGEAGKTTWSEWARQNIKISESRLRELQRIAGAEDPKKELERLRNMTSERVKRHREKTKSAPLRNAGAIAKVTTAIENDRNNLIEWARSAPLYHVTKVLAFTQQFDAVGANSDISAPTTPIVS